MRLKTFITGMLLTSVALAQMTSFPKPDWFRETFQKAQTKVELRDPVKLKDFVVAGKLELSLKHYLELVMSNNTDIQIQMLSLEMPKNAILMAMGVWDPSVRASFNTTRTTSYVTNPSQALDSAAVNSAVKSLNQPYSAAGRRRSRTARSTRRASRDRKRHPLLSRPAPITSELQNAGMAFNLTQPLLRNRGTYVNKIPLMQAQSNLKVSEYQSAQPAPDAGQYRGSRLLDRDLEPRDAQSAGSGARRFRRLPQVHAGPARSRRAFAPGYFQSARLPWQRRSSPFPRRVSHWRNRKMCCAASLAPISIPKSASCPIVLTEPVELGRPISFRGSRGCGDARR